MNFEILFFTCHYHICFMEKIDDINVATYCHAKIKSHRASYIPFLSKSFLDINKVIFYGAPLQKILVTF